MPVKVVFIISTGRTGTKALAEFFNSNFDSVAAYHQPSFSRIVNVASNLYLCGKLNGNSLHRLVRKLKKRRIEKTPEQFYIEANSLNYGVSKILREIFDNVAIIHIVRDPRTFVRSYLNWVHTRTKSYIANKLTPFWQPSGVLTGEISKEEWDNFEEFQRVAWYWTFKNRRIEQMHEGDGGYLRLRFEDIFDKAKCETNLKGLLDFIGLPYKDNLVSFVNSKKNVSKKSYCPPFSEWSVEKKRRLYEICAPLMREYGYTIES